VKYFRSLPNHHSQKETVICDEYSIFEYDVKPTYDFQQAILSHAPDVVVLEPQSLREEIRWKVEELNKRYNVF
jgi:predicted DNA-binding transcriptional regulator YafY